MLNVKIYSKRVHETGSVTFKEALITIEKELCELLQNGWMIISSTVNEDQFIATLVK